MSGHENSTISAQESYNRRHGDEVFIETSKSTALVRNKLSVLFQTVLYHKQIYTRIFTP
jgi:hypothetical protein